MISLAILGAGRWGNHLIRNFLSQDRAEIVAIVDPKPAQLNWIKQQYSFPPSVQFLTDWRSVLGGQLKLDGIVVVTPALTHRTIVEAALLNQLHVLAEKPLTLGRVIN